MTKKQYLKAKENGNIDRLIKSEVDAISEEKYPKANFKNMSAEEKESCTLYRRQLWKEQVAEMKAIRAELGVEA